MPRALLSFLERFLCREGHFRLKSASAPLYGEQVRERMPSLSLGACLREDTHAPYAYIAQMRRRMERIVYPMDYANPSGPFHGYDDGARDDRAYRTGVKGASASSPFSSRHPSCAPLLPYPAVIRLADHDDAHADGPVEDFPEHDHEVAQVLVFQPIALHAVARPDDHGTVRVYRQQFGRANPDGEGRAAHPVLQILERQRPDLPVRRPGGRRCGG